MTQLMLMFAAQIVVSVALIVWTRARVRRFLGSEEELERIRREIGALVIELDASADRNVTVMEDRLTALKDLVQEADKRIAILGQDRARRQPEPPVYDRQGRLADPGQSRSMPSPLETPLQQRVAQQPVAQLPVAPQPIAQQTVAQQRAQEARREPERPADQSVPFIRFSEKPLPVEEPFADKVVSLYRRGFSSDIIAARLGVTMAEVDLVIALERERGGQTKE